jgi:hypothetical protein
VNTRVVYNFFDNMFMQDIVDFAMATLKEKSPVGSGKDKHPGLYRDSHLIFLQGHVVKDVAAWRPGDQINISNPEPYARRIEAGGFTVSVPGHVYEDTAQIVAGRYGNSASIKFVYMPVTFGSNADYAAFSTRQRTGRKLSDKARKDWLSRQPALQITQR